MPRYAVQLLGKFNVRRDATPVPGLESRKAQELLGYLLLYRRQSHTREALANQLWGNLPTSQSRAYLRKALWQLQAAIDSEKQPCATHLLIVEPEWVQVNSDADLSLDIATLEQISSRAQSLPGEAISEPLAAELRYATSLYQGDLLDGCYQEWCIFERERLLTLYLTLLDKLTAYCESHGDYERGLTYGTLILRHDCAREQTHQRLMRLHFLAGDRSSALRQYDRCSSALKEELDVAPAPLTLALYESIKANQLLGLSPTVRPAITNGQDASLLDLLKELQELSQGLATLYGQLQQKISALEHVITHHD